MAGGCAGVRAGGWEMAGRCAGVRAEGLGDGW